MLATHSAASKEVAAGHEELVKNSNVATVSIHWPSNICGEDLCFL